MGIKEFEMSVHVSTSHLQAQSKLTWKKALTMSNYILGAAQFSNPKPPSEEKASDQYQTTNKVAPQTSITFVYQAKVAEFLRNVTVTWCKNLINHSLSITVENPSDENKNTCKVDIRTWHFWGRKGLKSFELDGKLVGIFWDFRQAKFSSSSPEPCSDYYVAMVSDEEVVLLLGDLKNEAFQRTRTRPSLEDATLLYKKEHVYGKRSFCTRAMLADGGKEHYIFIETSLPGAGPGDPEMWISIDSTVLIRVMNLNWRFRGNETAMVNNLPVQILWDVHDWLHGKPGSGRPGLFIFKTGAPECVSDHDDPDDENCSRENEGGSIYGSAASLQECPSTPEFCHFLYAWRTDHQ
jgi:Fe-S cluster assembly iron-binding protein IscA